MNIIKKLIAEYLWAQKKFGQYINVYIEDLIICHNKFLLLEWYLKNKIKITFGRYGINHAINRGYQETLELLIKYQKYQFLPKDLTRVTQLYFAWSNSFIERGWYFSKKEWENKMLQLQKFIQYHMIR